MWKFNKDIKDIQLLTQIITKRESIRTFKSKSKRGKSIQIVQKEKQKIYRKVLKIIKNKGQASLGHFKSKVTTLINHWNPLVSSKIINKNESIKEKPVISNKRMGGNTKSNLITKNMDLESPKQRKSSKKPFKNLNNKYCINPQNINPGTMEKMAISEHQKS